MIVVNELERNIIIKRMWQMWPSWLIMQSNILVLLLTVMVTHLQESFQFFIIKFIFFNHTILESQVSFSLAESEHVGPQAIN